HHPVDHQRDPAQDHGRADGPVEGGRLRLGARRCAYDLAPEHRRGLAAPRGVLKPPAGRAALFRPGTRHGSWTPLRSPARRTASGGGIRCAGVAIPDPRLPRRRSPLCLSALQSGFGGDVIRAPFAPLLAAFLSFAALPAVAQVAGRDPAAWPARRSRPRRPGRPSRRSAPGSTPWLRRPCTQRPGRPGRSSNGAPRSSAWRPARSRTTRSSAAPPRLPPRSRPLCRGPDPPAVSPARRVPPVLLAHLHYPAAVL